MRAIVALLVLLTSPVSDQPRDVPVRGMVRQAVRGMPSRGDPPLPSGAVYLFDSRSVDGYFNATLTHASAVASWDNRGSGGNATQTAAGRKPAMDYASIHGWPSVLFDGGSDMMTIDSSAAGMSFIQNTGAFELAIVFRKTAPGTAQALAANTNTSTEKGFYWASTATEKIMLFGVRGAGGIVWNYTTTASHAAPGWCKVGAYGDGTKAYVSANMVTYEATAAYGAFSSGDAARAVGVGAANLDPAAPINFLGGGVAFLAVYDRALSAAERAQLNAFISVVFGV